MTKQIDKILLDVKESITPSTDNLKFMQDTLNRTVAKLKAEIKAKKIVAQVFVGGSFAKGTVVKKDSYDADVFVRFDKKYSEVEFVKILERLVKKVAVNKKNILTVHGSRDYFQIKISNDFMIELIPVRKTSTPEKAENITDLSYSHVNYLNKNIKSKAVLEEIKIAKAFCSAINCYGAESYISGFSGYALELLIYKYGTFEKFLREMVKVKNKLVIDMEKHYKNSKQVMLDLNESKLESPVILIDPTFKQRNALAALSNKTFGLFLKKAKEFLRKPTTKMFEKEKVNLERIEANAIRGKKEFILIEATTNKQEGDVAGSKLLKFYNHVTENFSKYYKISNKGFNYNKKQSARFFFVLTANEKIEFSGPSVSDKKNVAAFKKMHKKTFTKNGFLCAKEPFKKTSKEFFSIWKKKGARRIKEMYIIAINLVK